MASITGVTQVHISVRDLQRQVGFYRDVLGLPVVIDAGTLVFLDAGGTRLYLSEPESEERRSNPLLYFATDDIDQMLDQVRMAGATTVGEPHVIHSTDTSDLWLAFIKDAEDNLVGLMEERPKRPSS